MFFLLSTDIIIYIALFPPFTGDIQYKNTYAHEKGSLSKWHARYIREVTQIMKTAEHNYIYNGKNSKMSTSHT